MFQILLPYHTFTDMDMKLENWKKMIFEKNRLDTFDQWIYRNDENASCSSEKVMFNFHILYSVCFHFLMQKSSVFYLWGINDCSILQMAKAGFFMDCAEDPSSATCFCCMKTLNGWEKNDVPLYVFIFVHFFSKFKSFFQVLFQCL